MSIIEKAIGKLGGISKQKPPQVDKPNTIEAGAKVGSADLGADQESLESQSQINNEKTEQKIVHTIPMAEMQDKGMVTLDLPRSSIAEEYRVIKRPLLMNVAQKGPEAPKNANLIMVTSAVSGEGKTFSAINLAMSISMEQDKTVLFVDADVAKASAGNLLGLSDDCSGLIDVLERDGLGVEDVIINTSVPNFKMLAAGHINQRSTELLASEGMHKLMIELSERYNDRIIIFDSPPLLMTTEASVLASFMGQIAFVVSADQTSQDLVSEALEHIASDKVVGMILNKMKKYSRGKSGSGYGYGYGYGYGSARMAK